MEMKNECEKGMCGKGKGCMCGGMCGMDGHMGMRMLVKAILGVLLVSVIFSMGFRLGIVVGSIGGEYNHHRMMYDDSGWNSPVMMYGYAPDASVVSPTAGSTSSKK